MQVTAGITVEELCRLTGDAAFAIDALLVKHTGYDIHGHPANYAHYESIMPKLVDLFGQLNYLCTELEIRDDCGQDVLVKHKL